MQFVHPFCGPLYALTYIGRRRERTLGDLKKLQQAVVATTDETIALIETEQFHDSGGGAVDMALLASALLTPDTLLWTKDKKLDVLAKRLGVAFSAASHSFPKRT